MAAEQNDDICKETENSSIPLAIENNAGTNSIPIDDKTSAGEITIDKLSETSAIANNNNDSTNNASETKTNGNIVGVAASAAGVKNKKKNKKGKSGASNENGINKDEIEDCEQGDTAVQV